MEEGGRAREEDGGRRDHLPFNQEPSPEIRITLPQSRFNPFIRVEPAISTTSSSMCQKKVH
jgi:hypothetical protein